MSFQQFALFAAVAKHRNITKAALELHTSQPSVSKHLKILEDNYSVTLFTRGRKGIEITEEGREFLKYIDPILDQMRLLERRFSIRSQPTRRGPLRLGASYVLSASVLPSILKKFNKLFPTVEVILRSNSSTILQEMIIKGTLEIVFTSIAADAPELTAEPCVPLKLIAFAAKDYSIETKEQRISKLPLIIRDSGMLSGTTEKLLSRLRKQGYKPKVILRCESPEAIKMAVS